MAEPLNARLSDSGLRYYEWNGEQLMSVTSYRRVVGMSIQLHNWAVGQVVEAGVLARNDLVINALPDPDYAKAIRRAGTLKRDKAAELGTLVHEAAAMGLRPSALPDEDERKVFLGRYYEAMETMGWKVVCNEVQVFNLTKRYAGSLDLIVYDTIKNDYALLDIKTGKGIYPDAALQLDMYRRGEFCGGYDPISEQDVVDEETTDFLKAVEKMGILHLRPEGWDYIPVAITPELTQAADDMMSFAHWVTEHPDMTGLVVPKGTTLG